MFIIDRTVKLNWHFIFLNFSKGISRIRLLAITVKTTLNFRLYFTFKNEDSIKKVYQQSDLMKLSQIYGESTSLKPLNMSSDRDLSLNLTVNYPIGFLIILVGITGIAYTQL